MQRLGTKDGQNALEKEIPLGRMGKKGDIASMAVFLFSEEGEFYSFSLGLQIFIIILSPARPLEFGPYL